MGWIFRRGISCCRWASEDCHLVLICLGVLARSHWARRALVQDAILYSWVEVVVVVASACSEHQMFTDASLSSTEVSLSPDMVCYTRCGERLDLFI